MNFTRHLLFIAPAFFILTSCQEHANNRTDVWRGQLEMNDSTLLPFLFEWNGEQMVIRNAGERIVLDEIERRGDSLILHFPVFQTALHVQDRDNNWTGYWVKYDAHNYRMPFMATRGDTLRFHPAQAPGCSINSRWQVEFRTGKANPAPAIGEFFQKENGIVTGSFLTETGDYRYLEGVVDGRHLSLSGFDGGSAYLFTAEVEGDNMQGWHYSGLTYVEPWKAVRNDTFTLRNANALTFLKPGMDSVYFTLPDLNNRPFVFQPSVQSGPTIIQIMGSWCHNCMDETRYLRELYKRHSAEGLQIIGITYERSSNTDTALPAINKMIRDLEIPYPVVFGGRASGKSIAETLPMIDNFMSYPTTLFIDARGVVRKIHTGFAGPGTGAYDAYVEETDEFVAGLVVEPTN